MGYRINDDSFSWLLDGPLKFTRLGWLRRLMDPQLTASRKRTHQKGLPPTWADNVPTLSLARLKLQRKKRFQQKTVTSIYVCLAKKANTRGTSGSFFSGTNENSHFTPFFSQLVSQAPTGSTGQSHSWTPFQNLLFGEVYLGTKCRKPKTSPGVLNGLEPKKNGVSVFRCFTKTAFVTISGRRKLRVFWWVIINSWALGETTNQLQEVVDFSLEQVVDI